jgi:3-oxoadipate enol-lactonase/4-carboxymuconolactone decarboxylase
MADDVIANAPPRMHLVGTLLGGSVGLHIAIRHPDRVASLIIVATSTHTNSSLLADRAVVVAGGDRLVEPTLERWFGAERLAERPVPEEISYARRSLSAMPVAALAGCWAALARHDVRPQLPTLRTPVTVVAGSHDVVHSPELTRRDAAAIPRSRFDVVEAGHMVPLDNPNGLAEAVERHLAADFSANSLR